MGLRLFFFFSFLLPITVCAQEINEFNASWLDVNLELDWNKRVAFELKQSTRYLEFYEDYESSHTTFKASYEIKDWLKVIGGYRYISRERNNRRFNRYQLALQARTSIDKIKLTWRSRYEYRDAIDRDRTTTRLRNRLSAAYNIKKIDLEPKVFMEYWYTFDEDIKDFSKYRIGLALTKGIVKRLEAKLGYYYDADINQEEIDQKHIVLLGLAYKFKRKKATK